MGTLNESGVCPSLCLSAPATAQEQCVLELSRAKSWIHRSKVVQMSVSVKPKTIRRPFPRRWACMVINDWTLQRMVSAMPDLRLPSQPQSITIDLLAYWLYDINNTCVITGAQHKGVNMHLRRVVTQASSDRKSNPRPLESRSQVRHRARHRATRITISNFFVLHCVIMYVYRWQYTVSCALCIVFSVSTWHCW